MRKIRILINKINSRPVLILALLIGTILPVFTSVIPAQAAACSGSDLTITRQSSAAFYVDTGYQHRYIAYSITTSASKSYSDLYVTWTNNGSSLAINSGGETFEDGTYHVGALGPSSTAYVYFYLKSTVVPPGNTPAGVQNYNLNLFNGSPVGNTADCTSAQSNTSISTNGFANSNKVTSVTYTAPYLGSSFSMTVIGDTGQIGSGKIFSYSPAALGTWNGDCMELRSTSIVLSGGNTGTYNNVLLLTATQLTNSTDTHYVITYTFDAKCVTSSSTAVAPLSYISSGSGLNHTNTAGFSSLPPIAPATNSIVMTKSVNPASSTNGGVTTYAVNITNNGPSSASIDSVVDVLPSSPANASYVTGTSYYDDNISGGASAASIADPSGAGQTKTWTRTFTIPSGKTGQLTYNVTIPSTAGTYLNSATGRSNTTVIDQTVDTTDNSPAVATYGVGNLSMAGSTKTASDINGGSLQPGDIIEYTVVAEASGNENAQNVQITDVIDTNTENLTNVVIGAEATNCGASYVNNSSSSQLNISGVNIAFGTSCIITFRVSVKTTAASGTTILNTATIDPANAGGITGTPSSTPMVVRKDPILSVTNVENDADNVVIPNQVITYTVTIRNTGQADANGVDLVATIAGPVGSLSSRTITNCGSAYVDTSTGLSINIAALAITTSANCVITYTYTVNSGATSGTVTNSVDITAAREGGNDPAAVNASNLLIGAAPTPPNLSVTMSENDVDNYVTPGQSVVYTTTITNSGQTDATTSLVSEVPTGMGSPSSVTYSNCGTPSSNYSQPALSISSISIPAANICTITYTVVVSSPLDEGTELTASVDVAAASQGGNNPASVNASTLIVDATPVLNVSFSENDADNTVTPNQVITYTLTINNTGNGTATIVDAIDNLIGPAGNPSTFSFTNCGNVYANNSVTFLDIVDVRISVGTPCVVTYQNTVNSNASGGSTIDNSVDVSSAAEGGGDPIPVAASTLTVSAFPDLAVTTTENDSDNIVTPGQDITYTTTITNTGTSSASGVSLVDTFSGSINSITNFSLTNCGGVSSNGSSGLTVSITNLQIASSASCVIVYHVFVSLGAAGGSSIQNSADVSVAAEGGNNPAAVSATVQTVATIPNLAVTVADNDVDNIVTPSQTIGFTITISNTGNGTGVTNASISIPSELNAPSSISFSNCGSASSSYSEQLLIFTNMTVTTSNSCIITFNSVVKTPGVEDSTFDITVDVATAAQGGNNPDAVDSSQFTINTTPVLLTSTFVQTDENGGTLKPGETINYTITIKNTGDGNATGVFISNNFPAGITINVGSITFSNCGTTNDDSTSSGLDISNVSIAVGTDCVITYSGVVDSPQNVVTTISSSVSVGPANEGGDGTSLTTGNLNIDTTPNLSTSTLVGDDLNNGSLEPSDKIGYTLTIKNTGDGKASGVNLADVINTNTLLDINSFTFTNCGVDFSNTSTSTSLIISNLHITTDDDCVVYFEVTTKSPLNEGTLISETITISEANEGGAGANPSSSTLQINATPQLEVTISDDDTDNIVGLGQNVGMILTIKNTGNGDATNVDAAYNVSGPVGGIGSIITTNCGSVLAIDHNSSSLTVNDITLLAGTTCTIQFIIVVSDSGQNEATITHSIDVSAAAEGGNNPDEVSGETLTIDASNTAPNIPIGVDSIELHDNTFVNQADLEGATIYATITDPNEEDQVGYRIQIARDCLFSNPQIDYESQLDNQGGFSFVYQENEGTYLAGSSDYMLTDGSYCYRIRSIDEHGATSSWYQTDALKFKIDHTPPVKPITPLLIGEAGIGYADIGWDETDETSPDPLLPYRLEYSLDPNFGEFTVIDTADLHKLLEGLTPGVHYYFRLYVKDSAGNLSEPSDVLDVLIPSIIPDPDPDPDPNPDPDPTPTTNPTPTPSAPAPTKRYATVTQAPKNQVSQAAPDPVKQTDNSQITRNDGSTDQSTTVDITVVDQNGNKIKGAKVTIYSDPQTGYTDKNGHVVFYGVPIGNHEVVVEYAGKISNSYISITKGTTELKIDVVMTSVSVKQCGWWCWLWLLLLIPLYYLIRRHYQKKRDKHALLKSRQ